MQASGPKFQRRKEDRPGEILAAALQVFAEKGYAAARLDDIATRAGVSKGALYLYYETKADLFHAVLHSVVAPNIAKVREVIGSYDGPFAALLNTFAQVFSVTAEQSPVGQIAKMVVGESRNFPELARDWYAQIVEPMVELMTRVIGQAQARGEVRVGDPRLYAVQMVAPFLMAILWRETFVPVGGAPLDFRQVAEQHVATMRQGMLTPVGAIS